MTRGDDGDSLLFRSVLRCGHGYYSPPELQVVTYLVETDLFIQIMKISI
jgi:hypothetical protein